jgi:drug/metabolite transporter (DMT)-like permease
VTSRSSLAGGLFALLAGATFGVTTPFVHQLGAGVGTFGTSALLYAGSAIVCSIRRTRPAARIPRRDMLRLVAVALIGGVLAPALLVWGLARTDGARASLALGVEMPFTVLLARLLFREPIGLRMGAAVMAMLASTTLLALPAKLSGLADSAGSSAFPAGAASTIGLLAVIGAALAWATDSAVMRPLSAYDPRSVVARKSAIGALVSALLALAAGESLPPLRALLPLAALGALGYGVSLQAYLLAQRRIGAARAASLFAIAPLAGAVTGVLAGQTRIDVRLGLAATACAFAVALQLAERGEAAPRTEKRGAPEERRVSLRP